MTYTKPSLITGRSVPCLLPLLCNLVPSASSVHTQNYLFLTFPSQPLHSSPPHSSSCTQTLSSHPSFLFLISSMQFPFPSVSLSFYLHLLGTDNILFIFDVSFFCFWFYFQVLSCIYWSHVCAWKPPCVWVIRSYQFNRSCRAHHPQRNTLECMYMYRILSLIERPWKKKQVNQ